MGKREAMVAEAIRIANDDSHGYSQAVRWGDDYDCSSLMYACAYYAGYDVPFGAGYTGTMVSDFTEAGFECLPYDGDLSDLDPGDILLNVAYHTEMYVGDGMFAGAHSSEDGGIYGQLGDQTGNEISVVPAYDYWAGWDYVLVPPADGDAPRQSQPPARSEAREVQLYPSNGTDAQKWKIEWVDKTWFALRNVASGKCLDVNGGSAEGGTAVQVYPANGSKAQRWRYEQRMGESTVSLVPACNEDLCLDCKGGSSKEGTKLITWAKHGGPNQDWIVADNRDGTVSYINNSTGEKLALDVVGGGR